MGGGGKSNTTTSEFKPPQEFMDAYKEALAMARGPANKPYQQYTGQLVAGLSPTQQQGIANVNAAQGMALPAIQRGMQYTTEAARGITPELYNQFYSPYVRDVANTTFANLMESQAQQQSGLKGGAIQAGAFGGDRSGVAQSEMARQQQLANAMAMSNIYQQGYTQATGLAGQQVANLGAMGQQLAGLGAGAQGSVLQGAQAQMAAGAQEQATEQARLQAAYDQWMQYQAYPYQQAQFFANIAQGLGAGAGGSSSTTAPAPNLGSQILGGVGAIGSIYSDKRMKENIQAVGKLNDGQTVYRYNFKGDPKTQIGLLAQEVEESKPGAVTQVKGLKMVDYKGATEDAAEMSSMGGVVMPSSDRQGLAGGGIPYYPYGNALGYVPEGKINVRSASIPDAPKPYEDEGLAAGWQDIKPLSQSQIGGLRQMASDLGLDLPEKKSAEDNGDGEDNERAPGLFSGLVRSLRGNAANGGVAARGHYADGGIGISPSQEDDEGVAAVPMPEAEFNAPAGLAQAESGDRFEARNPQGYVGRMQFGPARLEDARSAGVIPPEMSSEAFRVDPNAQKAAEAWHFKDINDFIDRSGISSVEGRRIKGIPVTRDGLVSVAHLGGKTGLKRFVESGGRYDPADANGTRLSDYLAMSAGNVKSQGVVPVVAPPMPEESDGVAAAAMPEGQEGSFVIPGEKPRSGLGGIFDIKKAFASEENPSLIERVMGRRLSPEARSAVMNASFALMAGRSPFFFTNLGEAGKVGTQTYYNALQQQRELAKQQADIALEKEGRDIQRMGTSAQIASVILPLIKALAATNQPIPPQYQRILDQAFPPGSNQRAKIDREIASGGASAVTEATPGAIPPTTADQSTEALSAPVVEDDLRNIYEKLPDELNPYEWDRRAKQADSVGAVELAQQYRETAREIRDADYEKGFINVPGEGRVPWPYKMEQELDVSGAKEEQNIAIKALDEAETEIQKMQSGFSQKTLTLNGLADALSKGETGALSELKAYTINVLNSFGMAGAEEVEQAQNIQEIVRFLGEALANNPDAKQNFGPQISNADIKIMMGVQGSVSDLPGANRRVVGAALGKLAWDKEKVRAWTEFSQKARESGKRPTRSDITKFNMDFSEGKYTDGKTAPDYVREATANTPVMGEINWSDPGKARLKEGYKYIVPRGTYPIGTFEDNVVVMWDGEKLVEVE